MKKFILFLLLFSFVVVSCDSDKNETTNDDITTTSLDCKRTGDEAVIRLAGPPSDLNPLSSSNAYSAQVFGLIFSYTMGADYDTYETEPYLVNSTTTASDQITSGEHKGLYAYEYEFRKEAKWDDGTPITGHDYVFTLKAVSVPQVKALSLQPYLSSIADVVVDNDNPRKMTIYVKEVIVDQEEYMANTFFLLPQHVYDSNSLLANVEVQGLLDGSIDQTNKDVIAFAEEFLAPENFRSPDRIVGSGPYKLESWTPGVELVLTKKENWWGDAFADQFDFFNAHPSKITFKIISDLSTSIAALKAGEIDALANLSPTQFLDLQKNPDVASCYNFNSLPTTSYYTVYLNTKHPILSDLNVRKALAHAVNVDNIINVVFNGYAQRVAAPVLPSREYYNKNNKLIPYDPQVATQMLNDAGWTDSDNDGTLDKMIDGQKTDFALDYKYVGKSERSKQVALLLQEQMKKAGVTLNLIAADPAKYLSDLKKGSFSIITGGRRLSPLSWNPAQGYYSTSGDNKSKFTSPELDKLIDELSVTLEQEKRNELYTEIQTMIYEGQPEIFLFTPKSTIVTHKRFDVVLTEVDPGFVSSSLKLK